MIFLDPALAASVALSLVIAGPIYFWVNSRFKTLALVRGDRVADSSGRMLEYVLGISVARAFNRTDDQLSQYSRAVRAIRQINNQLVLRLLPLGILTLCIVQLGVPLVITVAAYQWFGGAIDIGTVLIFSSPGAARLWADRSVGWAFRASETWRRGSRTHRPNHGFGGTGRAGYAALRASGL